MLIDRQRTRDILPVALSKRNKLNGAQKKRSTRVKNKFCSPIILKDFTEKERAQETFSSVIEVPRRREYSLDRRNEGNNVNDENNNGDDNFGMIQV